MGQPSIQRPQNWPSRWSHEGLAPHPYPFSNSRRPPLPERAHLPSHCPPHRPSGAPSLTLPATALPIQVPLCPLKSSPPSFGPCLGLPWSSFPPMLSGAACTPTAPAQLHCKLGADRTQPVLFPKVTAWQSAPTGHSIINSCRSWKPSPHHRRSGALPSRAHTPHSCLTLPTTLGKLTHSVTSGNWERKKGGPAGKEFPLPNKDFKLIFFSINSKK